MSQEYVHGYSPKEQARLQDQAVTLAELLHQDTAYPADSLVLEAGCGVGAQTVSLAAGSPGAKILSVDISEASVNAARQRVTQAGFTNVEFRQANIFDLPFEPETFDHVFVCFVLEHLPNPQEALACLRTVLKTGGSLTVIEGDHGSTYFHPDNLQAKRCVQCLIDLQASIGGDSRIGRRLYPLLVEAGFGPVDVSPRMVYVDGRKPALIDGFTRKTFTAMVEGVRRQALEQRMMTECEWDEGVAALYRTAQPDGVFCYTFFKAVGWK
jgi:SAM-dependent methyltransferase